MWQIVLAERTAAVSDRNLDAFVILWENQFHSFAGIVFEGVFQNSSESVKAMVNRRITNAAAARIKPATRGIPTSVILKT